jgi:hypothetical protein
LGAAFPAGIQFRSLLNRLTLTRWEDELTERVESISESTALLSPLRSVDVLSPRRVRSCEDSYSLDWLLAPIDTGTFFDEYWEKRPLLVNRNDAAYYTSLPGIDDVDSLIGVTSSHAARRSDDVRIVRTDAGCMLSERPIKLDANGFPDIHDAYRAYDEGYSFVLNRIHDRSAAVAQLCGALEGALHQPIGVNMYATPCNGQGFLQHADDHDVFIVQVHGTKEWHLASPAEELPLAVTHMTATRNRPVVADLGTFLLEQGDVLYIPRGFPHEATTTSSSSAHLTIGIHAFKWVDLVIEAVKVIAEDNRFLREGLPPGFLDMPLGSITAETAGDIAAMLQKEAVLESAKSRIEKKLLKYREVVQHGHLRSLDAIPLVTEDSPVVRAPGRTCRVRVDDDEAVIEFHGNFVAGPLSLKPMFDFVAQHERFVVSELPGDFSAADKVDLTRRLVSEGLIRIKDP